MTRALRIQTTVQAGGKLDLVCPQLAPGQQVDVLITPTLDANAQPPASRADSGGRRSVVDILNEAPGHLLFRDANEVDDYIREERASWDR